MRNLVKHGVRACCADFNPDQPVFRSVYGPAHLCPNPDKSPGEWLNFMIDLAEKLRTKPALICSADLYVTAVATHAAVLKDHFIFSEEGIVLQNALATKEFQYELAARHGLPVPKSLYVESREQVLAFAGTARFPCLLKPLHFREWEQFPQDHPLHGRKLVITNTAAELEDQYRTASAISPNMVVQEVIQGPDTSKRVYLSCYTRGGKRIAACIMGEFRTNPMYFGSPGLLEPVQDPEVDALCDGFLRGIRYEGLCDIELKRDTRDGGVKMIEANPRYSGSSDAATYAGVDLGWVHYLDLIGATPEFIGPTRWNFRHIVLTWDIPIISAYHRAGLLSWRELLRSYRPPVAFLDFEVREWRLSAETLVRVARSIIGQLLGRS